MKFKQLRDMIAFEAKLSDSINSLSGWLDTTMAEMFDTFTCLVKYPELYVPGTVLSLTDSTGIIALPADLQHLDIENIRFRQGGDASLDYTLYDRQGVWGENTGRPRFIISNSNGTNVAQISIWPTAEVTAADKLVINYWRHAIPENSSEDLILVPDQLVTTVKLAMIARASLFGSSKQYQIFKQESVASHSRSMGATKLGSTNG